MCQACDDRQSNIKPTEKRPEMPTAQNGTFGFARHTKPTLRKTKRDIFFQRTDDSVENNLITFYLVK
jgi:hypothetical protein